MDERVVTGEGSRQEPIPLPFDRIRRLVPAMVLCLLAMALFESTAMRRTPTTVVRALHERP